MREQATTKEGKKRIWCFASKVKKKRGGYTFWEVKVECTFGKVLQYRNLSVKFDFPLSLNKVLQFFFLLIDYVKSLMSNVKQLASEFSKNSSNVGQHYHALFPCAVSTSIQTKQIQSKKKLLRLNHSFKSSVCR